MKFTCEIEENDSISFLDCLITRNGDKLDTSGKNTFTGLGLSFFSFCPLMFKVNSIKTLLSRAKHVCSTFTALNKELSFLVQYFHNNGYPKPLVYAQIRKFIQSISHPTLVYATVEKRKMFISFPFFGPQSEKLKTEILDTLAKFYPQLDLKIILSNTYTIGSLFNYKDRLPMTLRSSIIYKYCCAHCASGYIGLTIRPLHMRIAEHQGRSFRSGNVPQNPVPSSIRDHSLKCSKQISSSEFSIIGHELPGNNLEMLESLHIYHHKPNLNINQSSYPLRIIN